jgi:Mn2+/Fe2+ NRAMP family transporter
VRLPARGVCREVEETRLTPSTHRWFRLLGPGLITGAADDDPSGIATYSQAGAQFGFQLGWTVVLTYPLMVGIQMVSARRCSPMSPSSSRSPCRGAR